MTTLASCFALASVFSGRRLEPRDTGDIQVRVFKEAGGQEWQVATDYTLKYMKLSDNDCARGSEAAQGLWAVSYGLIDLDSDPCCVPSAKRPRPSQSTTEP